MQHKNCIYYLASKQKTGKCSSENAQFILTSQTKLSFLTFLQIHHGIIILFCKIYFKKNLQVVKCVSSHLLLFLLLSMFQCVWGLVPGGIYLQHGSQQEGRTIQPVSTLWPRCHSPLMCAVGGAQTQQDWVDACWSQTVGPPGRHRAASDLLWSEGGDWLNCPLFLTIHTPHTPLHPL